MYDFAKNEGGETDSKNITLHGFSLGGAMAAHVDSELAGRKENIGQLVMHSSIDSVYKQGKDSVGMGFLGSLAGMGAKWAFGNLDTNESLKKFQEASGGEIPIHFMSGENRAGDQLDINKTELFKNAQGRATNKEKVTATRGTGGHLAETEGSDAHDDIAPRSHLTQKARGILGLKGPKKRKG